MTDQIIELPVRFAITLVDTSSFFGPAMLGTDPVPTTDSGSGADPTGTAPSTADPLGGALARVSQASTVARSAGAGAQAQNIDSAGAQTFATAP